MQKHVHPGQVVGGVVDFLTEEALFNNMGVEVLFGLQQQRARTTSRVINFIDAGLLVHGKLCNQLGNVLRGKEFTTGFTSISSIVGDEEFVSIAEQINLGDITFFIKIIPKIQTGHAVQYRRQATVFIFNGITKSVTGGIEVGKQTFDIAFGGIAIG